MKRFASSLFSLLYQQPTQSNTYNSVCVVMFYPSIPSKVVCCYPIPLNCNLTTRVSNQLVAFINPKHESLLSSMTPRILISMTSFYSKLLPNDFCVLNMIMTSPSLFLLFHFHHEMSHHDKFFINLVKYSKLLLS